MSAAQPLRTVVAALIAVGPSNDLSDALSDLSPAEWRAVVLAAAQHRCIACGEFDGCECSTHVDAGKETVVERAAAVGSN